MAGPPEILHQPTYQAQLRRWDSGFRLNVGSTSNAESGYGPPNGIPRFFEKTSTAANTSATISATSFAS
jgi:hypothetical protein